MDTQILGVAVYGFGRIGRVHAENTLKRPGLKLMYIIDIPSMEKAVQDTFGGAVEFLPLENEHKMLNDTNVHFVIICNPTEFHVTTIVKVAEAKKHILCEKPISLKVAEIQQSYDAAEKNDVHLLCAFNRRFDGKIRALHKKTLQARELGGKTHRATVVSRDFPYPDIRFLRKSGGVFHDCAVHDIDVLHWIFGAPPKFVQATGTYVMQGDVSGADVEPLCLDNALITLKWATGEIATICSSRISRSYDQRIEVFGDTFDLQVVNDIDPFSPALAEYDSAFLRPYMWMRETSVAKGHNFNQYFAHGHGHCFRAGS
eukprot:m.935315 g.935315  ORF g.935315 m.935315 type:complete len:315 (-) comp23803_c0_seq11:6565-7509(-)